MTTVYRIKHTETKKYWSGNGWSKNTGIIYTTKELAKKKY